MADGGGAAASLERQSMVAKHHDKLQAEKEAAGIAKLQASLPKLSRPVLAMALQDAKLDSDKALTLLRHFQSEMFNDLAIIQHKRQRLQVELHNVLSVSSESEDDRVRSKLNKPKYKKEKLKEKKRKKHKHKDKESKRRKRDRKGEADDPGQLAFGTFGVIREADYMRMRPEFAAWATEVKHIDIEALPRSDERDLYRSFMEDYNTCTLPSRKYYDLVAFERAHGTEAVHLEGRDAERTLDDEALRRAELQAERRYAEDASARDALAKMMLSGKHLNELKDREMLRLQAQEAYKTGDMSKAAKLMKKLNPDEEDPRDLEQGY